MKNFIVNMPYWLLIVMAVFLALSPFRPEPHLVQKFDMFMVGNLIKPLDMFDVLWHTLPVWLLITKFIIEKKG